MSITVHCRQCNKRFAAPLRLSGKRIRCKCGSVLNVPLAMAVAAEEAPPAATGDLMTAGAAFEAAASAEGCPNCSFPLAAEAILCTACGWNRRTGHCMAVAVEAVEAPAAPAGKPARPAKKKDDIHPERIDFIFKTIKVLVIVAVVAGLGVLAYYIKEAVSLDTRKQANEALAKISPGMTIAQVVKTLERPPREVWALQDPPAGSTRPPEDKRIGYAENFLKHHGRKKLKYGFRFVYLYSVRDQVHVHFTPRGKVESAELFDPMKALGM